MKRGRRSHRNDNQKQSNAHDLLLGHPQFQDFYFYPASLNLIPLLLFGYLYLWFWLHFHPGLLSTCFTSSKCPLLLSGANKLLYMQVAESNPPYIATVRPLLCPAPTSLSDYDRLRFRITSPVPCCSCIGHRSDLEDSGSTVSALLTPAPGVT